MVWRSLGSELSFLANAITGWSCILLWVGQSRREFCKSVSSLAILASYGSRLEQDLNRRKVVFGFGRLRGAEKGIDMSLSALFFAGFGYVAGVRAASGR